MFEFYYQIIFKLSHWLRFVGLGQISLTVSYFLSLLILCLILRFLLRFHKVYGFNFVSITSYLILLSFIAWPMIFGPIIHYMKCESDAGKTLVDTIKADGYLDSRILEMKTSKKNRYVKPEGTYYFNQAMTMMRERRIKYVEFAHRIRSSNGINYTKFTLEKKGSTLCDWYLDDFRKKSKYDLIQPGLCLGRSNSLRPISEIKISKKNKIDGLGNNHFGSVYYTEVKNRLTKETIAQIKDHQQLRIKFFKGISLSMRVEGCKVKQSEREQNNLLFQVLENSNGIAAPAKNSSFYNFMPPVEVKDNLKNIQLHKVKLKGGVPPGTNQHAKLVDVVVDIKENPIVLFLESEEYTMWNIKAEYGTVIPMVFIKQPEGFLAIKKSPNVGRYVQFPIKNKSKIPEDILKLLKRKPTSMKVLGRTKNVVIDGTSKKALLLNNDSPVEEIPKQLPVKDRKSTPLRKGFLGAELISFSTEEKHDKGIIVKGLIKRIHEIYDSIGIERKNSLEKLKKNNLIIGGSRLNSHLRSKIVITNNPIDIAFAENCILISNKDIKISHSKDNTIIGGANIEISHTHNNIIVTNGDIDISNDGFLYEGSSVFIASGVTKLSNAKNTIIYSEKGVEINNPENIRIYNAKYTYSDRRRLKSRKTHKLF